MPHSLPPQTNDDPSDGPGPVERPAKDYAFASRVQAARQGCQMSRGEILQQCRQYLLAAAGRHLSAELRGKVGGSDLVQETLTLAHQRFDRFTGNTEEELRAWLARILSYQALTVQRRYYETQKRGLNREVSLANAQAEALLPIDTPSPSARAVLNEQFQQLEAALAQLRPHERQVIELRNLQLLSFEEIGRQMGRSANATRKLWARTIARLTTHLKPPPGTASD